MISVLSLSTVVLADAGHEDIGKPGQASAAQRTMEVVLGEMYFKPNNLSVKAEETIRFVVKNEGQLLHEFNIGTPAMHALHRQEMVEMMKHGMMTATGINQQMMMHVGRSGMKHMEHDDPNSVLVEPGQTEELVWTFSHAGALEFACNMPGHSEAGMVGKLTVSTR
ncbi:MAG: plastocyanin/azurin family copper-binding protein [Candidatus Competibacteraceae bacterium]|jgi:uncharacterized cupredoxin-like copper-binding protein|nr:plastocyanin/azurin family copper-binding protein [Candidatus Competibacteraceae bacterium]